MVPSNPINLTIYFKQVTITTFSANVSPKTIALATTYIQAFSKSVDDHEADSLHIKP